MHRYRLGAGLLVLLTAGAAYAARYDRSNWEQLLLPVHPFRERAGAFGTLWATELTVFNAGTSPAEMFQVQCQQDCSCTITTICIPETPVAPGEFFGGFTGSDDVSSYPNPAAFLYVEKAKVDDVAINLRLFDAARGETSFGTEIPVVRESEFRTGKTVLVNVPTRADFRQQLRIFGISSPSGGGDVNVRIFSGGDTVPLAQTILRIAPAENRDTLPGADAFPRFPGYAEIMSLNALVPATTDRFRVEVEPLTPGLRYWAFISVTSNTTQQVTLITPQ